MRTLKELAIEAIEMQNACNLCGLAQRFAKVMVELGDHTKGTTERNTHPIVTLWLDKFASLNGLQFGDTQKLNGDFELVSKWSKE